MISDLEDGIEEITQSEHQKKQQNIFFKCKYSLRDLSNTIKYTNICIIGTSKRVEVEKGAEIFFEQK